MIIIIEFVLKHEKYYLWRRVVPMKYLRSVIHDTCFLALYFRRTSSLEMISYVFLVFRWQEVLWYKSQRFSSSHVDAALSLRQRETIRQLGLFIRPYVSTCLHSKSLLRNLLYYVYIKESLLFIVWRPRKSDIFGRIMSTSPAAAGGILCEVFAIGFCCK